MPKSAKNVLHMVGLEPLTLSHITSLKKVPAFGCLDDPFADIIDSAMVTFLPLRYGS